MVNNNEDSEYSNDSSQSYDSDISPQNTSRPIYSESKNDEFSDEEIESDIHHGTWINAGTERPRFPFIGIQIKWKMKNSEMFRTFWIELAELKSRDTNRYAQQFERYHTEIYICKPNSKGYKHIMLR